MFAMMKRSLAHAVLVGGLLSFLTPAAQAQDPIDITHACVQAMRTIANNTGGDIRDIRGATIETIRVLNEDDARDIVIASAGNLGRERINNRARAGVERVRTVSEACVDTLGDLDAPAWMVAKVIETRVSSMQRINRQRDRATDAVRAAVRAAIND